MVRRSLPSTVVCGKRVENKSTMHTAVECGREKNQI